MKYQPTVKRIETSLITRRALLGTALGTAAAASFPFALAGCGAGRSALSGANASGSSRGTAHFSVIWPVRTSEQSGESRLIPVQANCIRVLLEDPNKRFSTTPKLLIRPPDDTTGISLPTTVQWSDLPITTLRVTATAYPTKDGTGTALATAVADVSVVSGKVTEIRLSLNSTIDHVVITPDSLGFAVQSTAEYLLSAAAYDKDNQLVLTGGNKWTWAIDSPFLTAVSGTTGPTFRVRAAAIGTATVTATEQESKKTGSRQVQVRDGNRTEDGSGLAASPWPKALGTVGNNGIAPSGIAGTPLWSLDSPVNTYNGALIYSNITTINLDGSVLSSEYRIDGVHAALTSRDPETGNLRWSAQPADLMLGCTCGHDGTVYTFGTTYIDNGYTASLFAIKGSSGEVIWNKNVYDDRIEPRLSHILGQVNVGSDGRIYFTVDDSLVCLDAVTGEKIWEASLGQNVGQRAVYPVIDRQGHLYVYAYKRKNEGTAPIGSFIYAFYADGTPKWTIELSRFTIASNNWTAFDRGDIVLGDDGGLLTHSVSQNTNGEYVWSLSLLNADNGSTRWRTDLGEAFKALYGLPTPCLSSKGQIYTAYLGAHEVNLRALDYTTGNTLWTRPIAISASATGVGNVPRWLALNTSDVVMTYLDNLPDLSAKTCIGGVSGSDGKILWNVSVDATRTNTSSIPAFARSGAMYTQAWLFNGNGIPSPSRFFAIK